MGYEYYSLPVVQAVCPRPTTVYRCWSSVILLGPLVGRLGPHHLRHHHLKSSLRLFSIWLNRIMTWEDNETDVPSSGERIAVLGAHSPTGRHFCRLALDAGYVVQALIPAVTTTTTTSPSTSSRHNPQDRSDSDNNADASDNEEEDYERDHPNNDDIDGNNKNNNPDDEVHDFLEESEQLTVVRGALDHGASLEAVLENATYVVCFVVETLPKRNRDYPRKFMSTWIQLLYPLMKEAVAKVFLFQASWVAIDVHDPTPIISQVFKTLMSLQRQYYLRDQDSVIRYIVDHTTEDWLQFVITRPGIVCEGPNRKKLHASKSLPGPIPITHLDLAEFSLQALKMEQLYGTSPYIVGDGF